MENKHYLRFLVLSLFVVIIIGLRVIAPLSSDFKFIANFSGIGAVAIFSGIYFKNQILRFALPIGVLFLSDLGLISTMGADYGFYSGWYYTYIAFAMMILAAHLLVKKVKIQNVLLTSFVAVLIHWIVTDFGVWLGSTMYPQTLAGFWTCLVAAIPFELNFLFGTLLYVTIMILSFELIKQKLPVLKFDTYKV